MYVKSRRRHTLPFRHRKTLHASAVNSGRKLTYRLSGLSRASAGTLRYEDRPRTGRQYTYFSHGRNPYDMIPRLTRASIMHILPTSLLYLTKMTYSTTAQHVYLSETLQMTYSCPTVGCRQANLENFPSRKKQSDALRDVCAFALPSKLIRSAVIERNSCDVTLSPWS